MNIEPKPFHQEEDNLRKISEKVILVDPRNPNYENVSIGIEITTPGFEGINLDHHKPGDTSDTPSAIEQALDLELDKIPREGKFATVRIDPDSAGAIAILILRLENQDSKIDRQLVKAIGLLDRKGPGVFKNQGQQLLNVSKEIFYELFKKVSVARYQIISQRISLDKAVLFMKKLITNQISEEEIEKIYNKDQQELEKARQELKIENIANGKAVIITGNHPRAFEIGYEYAPIVIAYSPQFDWGDGTVTPKFTIARYDSNVRNINMNGLLNELNKIKQGWGGRDNIIGSPQKQDPGIGLEELKKIVEKYIE
ncbi:MAG: hypothetical protein KatS3mg095_0556 [Candidatus Parcubacteria bacterium]|nr:MAG: hypothetical protein KatS3mg095_0556 [Candidatus Parcubacteria bacterium]